ncbi:hypothetical protein [Pseudoalteromonas sp. McH1-42]|uniref:hypothetical protein n=1 Tax=Pseudoalteromonas sp. McH1-42 TaxID=2917752 RepID=UPI001EF5A9D4|nr:hypothetical protein [Pseudoalteromonas sp. McH1-42]MCG7563338.1 hypothetical protein [Pseudoalteromonas sp. McH1-42]
MTIQTKNQRYERKQKQKGLVKRTLWIPAGVEVEVKQMIQFLLENPDYVPAQARSLKTGRFKKID